MKTIVLGLTLFLVASSVNAQENNPFHFAGDLLSDEDPGSKEYDHEAFLGEDIADEFDDLVPEESQKRLGEIFVKMDSDEDGSVTLEELEKWITETQDRFIESDTKKRLEKLDVDEDGQVSWQEHYNFTYGTLKDDADWDANVKDGLSYRDMVNRDKNRWKLADSDDDDSCSLEEFKAFIHPQHFDRTKNLLFEETMADLDKNKDGFLDVEEYISDVYRPETEGEPEPDWVAAEREEFSSDRDMDKDGKLDENEVREWVMPDKANFARAEAKHLVSESDSDQDGALTKEEVLDHYDTFVGSQATQYGEMFEGHDEF